MNRRPKFKTPKILPRCKNTSGMKTKTSRISKNTPLALRRQKRFLKIKMLWNFGGNSPTEYRILRIGKTLGKILIAVVYTLRSVSIRIISARQASKEETKSYLENSLSKQADNESES